MLSRIGLNPSLLLAAAALVPVVFQTSIETTLCLAGGIRRVGGVEFEAAGGLVFDVDPAGWPAGQTAYFQSFFRDPQFGLSVSEAISVPIQ